LDAVGLSVVTAFLAGLYPAWRASNMSIVDALRHAH
jgi:ABC-type lipoprotein release transport system permease subunit